MDSLLALLDKNRGIVFGDDHDKPAITTYLTGQMKTLADAGVKILFLEVLPASANGEGWLEDFNYGQNGTAREAMKNWLAHCNKYPPRTIQDYMQMFDAARANGITLVGIEPPTRDILHGIKSSNAAWQKTISAYLGSHPEVKKYAVFGGKLHTHLANQESGDHECDQATGIDKLLGVPCVTFNTNAYSALSTARLGTTYEPDTYILALSNLSPRPILTRVTR